MSEVIFGFGAVVLNSIIFYIFNKILKKVNIMEIIDLKFIPEWIKGIMYMILILLTCPAIIVLLTSGFVLYDFVIDKDVIKIIMTIIIVIISNIYVNIVKVSK